uniref:Uncharacterized protein n=1 Tax=Oryza punctata TaxID=4537 RepID=A0A0E0K498_ORYPU
MADRERQGNDRGKKRNEDCGCKGYVPPFFWVIGSETNATCGDEITRDKAAKARNDV